MGKIIGKCALCKNENVELRESHIIPKFVYRRIKKYPNSRFRNYYDINKIYQDGEKKPLLCNECEGFFSKFEVKFTNQVVDKYLLDKIRIGVNKEKYDDFIFSLNWRIIYDDVYILQSFKDDLFIHKPFYEMEQVIYSYLNAKRNKEKFEKPKNLKNYIFYADELGLREEDINMLNGGTIGYSFSADKNSKYIILTYFLGIICVTVYEPTIIIFDSIFNIIKRKLNLVSVKKIIKRELIYQYNCMKNQEIENEKILSNGLREKIENRYNK